MMWANLLFIRLYYCIEVFLSGAFFKPFFDFISPFNLQNQSNKF